MTEHVNNLLLSTSPPISLAIPHLSPLEINLCVATQLYPLLLLYASVKKYRPDPVYGLQIGWQIL